MELVRLPEVDGRRILVDSENWAGTRDRSWGIRLLVYRMLKNPQPLISQYWLWAPANWSDAVSFYHRNDDALGNTWNEAGFLSGWLVREPSSPVASGFHSWHSARKKSKNSFQGPSDVTEITMTPDSIGT